MTSKRISRTIGLQTICLLAAFAVQAQWSVAHLSEARERPYPVVVGHLALFVTGPTTGGGESSNVDIYDANTNTWTVHSLPFTNYNGNPNPPVVTKDGLVFFVDELNLSDEIQIFNSLDNSWATATLSEARKYVSVGIAGDYVVFAGGLILAGASATVDLYHVTNKTWHTAQLSEPRAYIAITGLGHKIFLGGGIKASSLSDRADILDTDTWVYETATLVEKRGLIEAVTVGDKVLFAGGGQFDFYNYNQVDIYDGATGTWSAATLQQNDLAGNMKSAVVGNKVYFQGGNNQRIMDVYDAENESWSSVLMPTDHVIGAFVHAGSKLYFAGGVNDLAGAVETYDCGSGAWATIGHLSIPRYWVSGAIVGNKLILAGGYGSGYSNVVDIYTGISNGTVSLSFEALPPIYPNPAHGSVLVTLPEGAATLRLFDMNGRVLLTAPVAHEREKTIQTAGLMPGNYLVVVEGNGLVYRGKVIVE